MNHKIKVKNFIDSSGKRGVTCQEITEYLNIFQYNARILQVRDDAGCKCKHGVNKKCKARYHIINLEKFKPLPRFFSHYGNIQTFKIGGEKNEKN